jgi:anion-transporting  ArsA/GET3 family ATPase
MPSLLDRKLLFVTGKGGVGKTTMAAALGLLAARDGRRVIVVEVGEQSRIPALFGEREHAAGVETQLERELASISIDPDRALLEWLQALGGRVSGRVLASSGTFQYFAAAAPGAKELFTMVKIWQLTRSKGRRRGYDLVVIDAPATGHALAMLASPRTFGAIARIGAVAGQTREIQALLEDEARTGYVAVALGSEMAVTEALDLQDGLRRQLGRDLSAVIVNGLLPRRFSTPEMQRIQAVARNGDTPEGVGLRGDRDAAGSVAQVRAAAVRAAVEVHERARFQHNQVARLRRRSFEVIPVPFVWQQQIDLAAVRKISERVAHGL